MTLYGWIIDVDHLDGSEAGVTGPRDISDLARRRLENGGGERFRMYDDDEILYYSGRVVGVGASNNLTEEAFAPLEDFGMPNAGCTIIKYRIDGKWQAI